MVDCKKESSLTLNRVLAWLDVKPLTTDITLLGVATDSRKVSPGDLFLALPGLASDGRDHIKAAVAAGAVAILAEAGRPLPPVTIPLIPIAGLRERSGGVIAYCFGDPSHRVSVLGVTGTNGKSSIVHFLASLLGRLSSGCGVMGTLGQGRLGHMVETGNTTPDPLTINRFLASLADQCVGWAAMEVSSHGIDQGRIDGLLIETAIFTNLTRDHLDYHGTMESYAEVKARLFQRPELRYGIINKDDPWGEFMIARAQAAQCLTYSLHDTEADVFLRDIVLHGHGMSAEIVTPWGSGLLQTSLLGRFNLSNLLAVITTLGAHGIALSNILAELPALQGAEGRLQCFGGGELPTVVVDYAHTPDALHNVLQALREHGDGNIICVFGCGGDRDRGKRALMAQAADRADHVVVTTDNPRSEEPEAIIADVLEGLTARDQNEVRVVVDRSEAIRSAIESAKQGDIVLVAGKGHETYQECKGVRYPFSDMAEVANVLFRRTM